MDDIINVIKAWGPGALAVLGAIVAVSQAVSARSQAKSARAQAVSAQEQAKDAGEAAEVAKRQARAAEEQVELARQQYRSEQQARDEAAGPVFQLGDAWDMVSGERFGTIVFTLVAGTRLDRVVVSAADQAAVLGLVEKVGEMDVASSMTLTNLAPGAMHTVVLMLDWNALSPVTVRLDFACHEGGGGSRTWSRSYSAQLNEPPASLSERPTRSTRLP
ncbi:hypothetical protein [Micromonospora sp. DT227]|uniref:hypothetical protein n=1 Tax=Micromonospora sp. DT227 TaxID=3393433 RepID=UPI003CEA6602